jgi:phosphatidylglycerol lysyltransferase
LRARNGSLERKALAAASVLLGLYNLAIMVFRAPLAKFELTEDLVPHDVVRGSRFLLVLVALTLFALAPPLWHGKRVAWLLALACGVGSVFAHPLKNVDLVGTAGGLLFVGALLGARPQFPARSDPPTALRGLVTLTVGVLVVFVYAVVGLYFLDSEFRHSISISLAVKDALRLMFVLPAIESEPRTHHAIWFTDSVRVSVVFVWLAGAIQLLRPVAYRLRTAPHEREQVRQILEQHGDSGLAFFALLPDKSYFFSDSGQSVLAYGVAGDTAIVLGDPLGDESEFKDLVAAFQQHCQLNGWAYAFNQARPQYLSLYESLGLKALKTGEEGIVAVQEFTLSGQAVKHLRATMNRFEREGFTAEVLSPPHSVELLERLKEISDAWLAQGHRRERRFMLGYFDEDLLQQCDLMVACDATGEIVAFANIIPSYRSPEGNFDMLRYGEEPKAVADFIYVSLIQHFKALGFTGMNLGLAPFSGLRDAPADSAATYALRLLYRYGGFLLRYQGLRGFKAKFTSVWQPRYLIYPTDAQLPGIALATMRVGEMPRKPHLRRGDRDEGPQSGRLEDATSASAP